MDKKFIAAISSLSILTTACVEPSIKEYTAPDGRSVKAVKCNKSPEKCFEKATSSCIDIGGTYQVVSSESHAGGLVADVLPGPITWYGITYICGPSDGKMPSFPFQGQQYVPPAVHIQNNTSQPTTINCNTIGNSTNCTSW